MLKIYVANVSDKDYTVGVEDIMSPERLEKYRRINHPESRNRSAAVAHLLRKALGTAHETYDPLGCPLVDGCFISISHSGDWVLVAVSDSEVGIDIERNRDAVIGSVAKKVFTESEQKSGRPFFELWTRKEALLKRLGCRVSHKEAETTDYNFISLPQFPGYTATVCTDQTEYEIIKEAE